MGTVDDSGKVYYFKRFLMRSTADAFKHLVRCSRAQRALQGGRLAALHGLGVPRPVCVIDAREFARVIGSAIITEQVEGAVPLDILLTGDGGKRPPGPGLRTAIAMQLGAEVGRWHAAGLVHGDMRHGNVLCRKDGGNYRFFFLDNERTRSTTSRHERARNLVQLNMIGPALFPLRDRVRFWRAYCRTAPGDRHYRQKLRAETVAWTRRRWHERGWL